MSSTKPTLFATVAVDQPVDATYTYAVPPEWHKQISVGSRVTVPLGRGNRLEPATVLALSDQPPALPAKDPKPKPVIETEPELFESAPQPVAANAFGLKPIAQVLPDITPIPADLL